MAGFFTHNYAFYDIIEQTGDKFKQQYGEIYNDYNLYAQGHDTLFSHYLFSKRGIFESITKPKILTKTLHTLEIGSIQDLTWNFISYLVNNNLEFDKEAKMFLFGYLMHHFIDANLHPLIIYKTGNLPESAGTHIRSEVVIDIHFLRMIEKMSTKNIKLHKFTENSKLRLESSTIDIIDNVFNKTYDIPALGRVFDSGFRNFKYLTTLRNDKYGILNALINPIVENSVLNLSYHTDKTDATYVMNLNHKQWKNPTDPTTEYNSDLLELYNYACKTIAGMITLLDMAIQDKANESEIRNLIPDVCSLDNRPCGLNRESFVCFDEEINSKRR